MLRLPHSNFGSRPHARRGHPWPAKSLKMQYMVKLLTPDEVAGGLQCSTKTVLKLARAGTLPSIRVGDLWRFDPDAIRRWIEGASSQAA